MQVAVRDAMVSGLGCSRQCTLPGVWQGLSECRLETLMLQGDNATRRCNVAVVLMIALDTMMI